MIPHPFRASFFARNREKLLAELPENAVVILSAHRNMQEAADSCFTFHQEPNFQYLTGIQEPDWQLIIDKQKNQTILVKPSMNVVHIAFDGLLSTEEALEMSGAERVMSVRQYTRWLKSANLSRRPVFTLLPQTRMARYMRLALNPSTRLLVRQLRGYGATPLDCRSHLAKLRAVKQPSEIKALQAAIDITNAGLEHVIKNKDTYKYEYEFEAELTREFLSRGAEGMAWKPIVAAGRHTCTMHHIKNDGLIKKNDWILMDVGARVHGYVADVARTVSVGTPKIWQKEIFDAVCELHDEVMALIRPGLEVATYVQQADDLLEDKLKRLGLMKRRSRKEMRRRMPHAIGHGLGIDAHDSLGRFETFQEGMVLTVEPGIYVNEKEFGVRIENDILITKEGAKNLSGGLPNRP